MPGPDSPGKKRSALIGRGVAAEDDAERAQLRSKRAERTYCASRVSGARSHGGHPLGRGARRVEHLTHRTSRQSAASSTSSRREAPARRCHGVMQRQPCESVVHQITPLRLGGFRRWRKHRWNGADRARSRGRMARHTRQMSQAGEGVRLDTSTAQAIPGRCGLCPSDQTRSCRARSCRRQRCVGAVPLNLNSGAGTPASSR